MLVEGANRVKKHQRPNPMKNTTGGIVDKEMPLHVSNVAIFNPVTKKGRPRRHQGCSMTAGGFASTNPMAK